MQRWRRSEGWILRQTPDPSASVTGTGHRRHREAAGTVLSDGPGEAKIESSWQIEGGSRWERLPALFWLFNQADFCDVTNLREGETFRTSIAVIYAS